MDFGGNELINAARTLGYSSTSGCGVSWLQCPPCDGIADVLGENTPYTYANITDAPWYDAQDPASHRFLGVSGLTVEGITDSTRTAETSESIGDGGTVSKPRHGTRRVRVEALLTAQGQDALEYGLSWLNAALIPRQCSVHGTSCGQADTRFFTACPPTRAEITKSEALWNDPITNLATNPSFEAATAATVEVRRNLITNPSFEVNTAGWSNYGASVTIARSTEQVHGAGAASLKITLSEATGSKGAQVRSIPVTPGQVLTVSAWFLATAGTSLTSLTFAWYNGAAFVSSQADQKTLTVGQWTRFTLTGTAPATATQVDVIANMPTATLADIRFVDEVMLELSPVVGTYFDGSTLPAGDFTHAWTGAANASASVQYGTAVVGATSNEAASVRSSEWASSGSVSVRTVPTTGSTVSVTYPAGSDGLTYGMQGGKTYTAQVKCRLSAPLTGTLWADSRMLVLQYQDSADGQWKYVRSVAAPNVAGVHTLFITAALPVTAVSAFIYLANGASRGNGDVWWDDFLIVEGDYQGPYFDGSFPDSTPAELETIGAQVAEYEWTGTPDASTSTYRTGTVIAVEDPVAWQAAVDALVRYMHTSTAVSGPTIVQKLHRGEVWGYIVEFVLVSAVPWTFGTTRQVITTPTIPEVIQDVPFNLVPYPSAEIAQGSVIAAKNFSINPSVEIDTTNWNASGNIANHVLSRTTELASVGTASAKSLITTTAAGSGNYTWLEHTVDLPGITPTTRLSFNVWGSASLESGTAELAGLELVAVWWNGATYITENVLASQPATGGAMSAKSVLPPAGTTKVTLRVRLGVASWAAGAKIRLYADAAAVTVP